MSCCPLSVHARTSLLTKVLSNLGCLVQARICVESMRYWQLSDTLEQIWNTVEISWWNSIDFKFFLSFPKIFLFSKLCFFCSIHSKIKHHKICIHPALITKRYYKIAAQYAVNRFVWYLNITKIKRFVNFQCLLFFRIH